MESDLFFKKKTKKIILPQMFDVRPVNVEGDLDLEKIEKAEKIIKIKPKRFFPKSEKSIGDVFYDVKKPDPDLLESKRFEKVLSEERESRNRRIFYKVPVQSPKLDNISNVTVEFKKTPDYISQKDEYFSENDNYFSDENIFYPQEPSFFEKLSALTRAIFSRDTYREENFTKKYIKSFLAASFVIFFMISGAALIYKGLKIRETALSKSEVAYADLEKAKEGMMNGDFQKSFFEFSAAQNQFSEISGELNSLGGILVESSKYVPFISKLSSGSHLAKIGEDISKVGVLSAKIFETLYKIKNSGGSGETTSYLEVFRETDKDIGDASALLKNIDKNLAEINIDDIPENKRNQFQLLRAKLPQINNFISDFSQNERIFSDILGGNGPRKYLFLFQNNQEMRATGGFIGSYAILDIFNGRVKKFFVDGIFNPDGQLKEKVVPPAPIQKISAAWSLHDSNWWPDFPKSAEKAAWFYEKTGGPTVDGVIAMTPTVMQKLLEVTGPIHMPDYGVTIDKDNFIEKIQSEVEVNYDKEDNQPKKILADLAPKILDKIFNDSSFSDMAKTMDILTESLGEKHILIYSMNWEIQKELSARSWTGEILNTQKDYLSVINTNINGYKTDGVISENISHQAEIQTDGKIIDTLTITRDHNGGDTPYDWWNKVNADYLRVYVPKGSKLLEASGETREFNSPPLDYSALGFKKDPQVAMEEDSATFDQDSGTKIYEDSGKTVFANWVYVSPKESVTITYKYLLPFKVETNFKDKPADTYSLLAQKQSGSEGSKFSSIIIYPDFYKTLWKYPDELSQENNSLKFDTDLKTDKFIGIALSKK